jgi:hypothetical protein
MSLQQLLDHFILLVEFNDLAALLRRPTILLWLTAKDHNLEMVAEQAETVNDPMPKVCTVFFISTEISEDSLEIQYY